ncbi:MAG: PQQ-binding-like beta-propeller repeat protein [Kiritimatiellia bacterium]|nr:PQQ-like beta-propeller repeat protein [Lentisphaerota bacterium]
MQKHYRQLNKLRSYKWRAGCLLAGCLFFHLAASAGEIAGWRHDGTGRFPAARPTTRWDDKANVIWKTATPEWSNASPVISGNRIFICAEPDILLCLDKTTGKILWQSSNSYQDITPADQHEELSEKMAQAAKVQKELNGISNKQRQLRQELKKTPEDAGLQQELAALQEQESEISKQLEPLEYYRLPSAHKANGYSSSTPVTDGINVYVYFGTGVAAAYDFDGNRLWARIIEKPQANWGHSASPALAGGHFIIHVRDVHALDPATGATVWTAKSSPRWGAMVTTEIDAQPVIITANGEIIHAADGKILAEGLHSLDYCAPMVHDGIVYFIENGGKAFRFPALADGTEQPEELWQTEPPKERYYASPLYHEGLIYCIQQKGVYNILDAQTGSVLKSAKIDSLKRTVYPSVTLAGSLIFIAAEGSQVLFLEPGVEMREVAAFGFEHFRTTPVFEGDRTYVRTLEAMYCIGQP